MSVLIRGMEMPSHCTECIFWHDGVFEHCIINESIQNEDLPEYAGEYPEACPLVKVPKNHGRLVDLDDLIAAGWQLSRDNIFTGKYEIALLSSVPTIIPAEEGE